jgi:plastocyanin
VTTGAAYVAPPMAGVVQPAAYSQPMAYPAANVAYVDPCCPQGGMTYGGGVSNQSSAVYRRGLFRRGARAAAYAPAPVSYAQPMPVAGGTYQAGYPPVHEHGAVPAGGIVPGQLPTRPADATTGDTAALEAKAVKITDGAFESADLEVKVGTTVKWTNDGKKPHTVTSDKGDWGSGELANGQTFTATFTKAGTFDYHCKLHPDMKAKITVR